MDDTQTVFKNWYSKNVGTRLLGSPEVERLQKAFQAAWDHQQAEIDRLMLEYCPDEMSDRQYEV